MCSVSSFITLQLLLNCSAYLSQVEVLVIVYAAAQVSLTRLWKPVLFHMTTTPKASLVNTRSLFIAEVIKLDTDLSVLSACALMCGESATALTVSVVAELKYNISSLTVDTLRFETLSECDPVPEGVSEDAWHLIKDDFTLASEQLRAHRQKGLVQWNVTEQDIVDAATGNTTQAASLLEVTHTREEFIARVLDIDKTVSVLQECVLECGSLPSTLSAACVGVLQGKVSKLNIGSASFETLSEIDVDAGLDSEDAWHLIKGEFVDFLQHIQDFRLTGFVTWSVTEFEIDIARNAVAYAVGVDLVAELAVRTATVGADSFEVITESASSVGIEALNETALQSMVCAARSELCRLQTSTKLKRRRLSRENTDASSCMGSPRTPRSVCARTTGGASPCSAGSFSSLPFEKSPLKSRMESLFNESPYAHLQSSGGSTGVALLESDKPLASSIISLSILLETKPLSAVTTAKIVSGRKVTLKAGSPMYQFDLATEQARATVIAWGAIASYVDGQMEGSMNKYVTVGPLRFDIYHGEPRLTLHGKNAAIQECETQPSWLNTVGVDHIPFSILSQKSDYAVVHIEALVNSLGDISSTSNLSQRRQIRLVDDRSTGLDLTLWGPHCENEGWVRCARIEILYATVNRERCTLDVNEGTQIKFIGKCAEAFMPRSIQMLSWTEYRRQNSRT